MSVELSPLELQSRSGLRRSAPRPQHLRQPGYEDAFDSSTVFYDCFRWPGRQWVVLIGPPLANLQPTIVDALQSALGKENYSDFIVRNLNRHSQIWIRAEASEFNVADSVFAQDHVAIQPPSDLFAGKRVVFTKSKDNDLQWIRDWAHFYVRNHQCNAVLLYDNASTRYTAADVRQTLASVHGLDTAMVVSWPFPWGPNGLDRILSVEPMQEFRPEVGDADVWDSDFCQYAIQEHARHRFLCLADAVVSADIDELVITGDRTSIFDIARQSATGYLLYKGIWIENACSEKVDDKRRHADFVHTAGQASAAKWTVIPERCPVTSQWRIHNINGMLADFTASRRVSYRHFRAISTGWRNRRWVPERPGQSHVVDAALVEWMACLSR